jgi:TusA-related sulfurtransferase
MTALPPADHFSTTLEVCYEVLLYLNSRMAKLQPGEVLEFDTTDPGAQNEIPGWCDLRGYTLVSIEPISDTQWRYKIQK